MSYHKILLLWVSRRRAELNEREAFAFTACHKGATTSINKCCGDEKNRLKSDDNEQDAQERVVFVEWIIVIHDERWMNDNSQEYPYHCWDERAAKSCQTTWKALCLSGFALSLSHVTGVWRESSDPARQNRIAWVSNNAPIQPFIMILRCWPPSGVIITCRPLRSLSLFKFETAHKKLTVFRRFRPAPRGVLFI